MQKQSVTVHDRVQKHHPDLAKNDVLQAWNNRLKCQIRQGPWPPQYVAIGFDNKGRSIEMVGVYDPFEDAVLIFHAQTP
ncbi:MAG: hypothetical protein RR997_06305, partial [Raoultibacter sp.]